MSIHSLRTTATPTIDIDMVLPFIGGIKKSEMTEYAVQHAQATRHQGDFYGLLHELGIHTDLHLLTTICNNIGSSDQFDGLGPMLVYVPDMVYIRKLSRLAKKLS